jgi:hypothetical protein
VLSDLGVAATIDGTLSLDLTNVLAELLPNVFLPGGGGGSGGFCPSEPSRVSAEKKPSPKRSSLSYRSAILSGIPDEKSKDWPC